MVATSVPTCVCRAVGMWLGQLKNLILNFIQLILNFYLNSHMWLVTTGHAVII